MGTVRWHLVVFLGPGVVIGAILGVWALGRLRSELVRALFSIVAAMGAVTVSRGPRRLTTYPSLSAASSVAISVTTLTTSPGVGAVRAPPTVDGADRPPSVDKATTR
jgi:uncharacterized membrane protein YfcA